MEDVSAVRLVGGHADASSALGSRAAWAVHGGGLPATAPGPAPPAAATSIATHVPRIVGTGVFCPTLHYRIRHCPYALTMCLGVLACHLCLHCRPAQVLTLRLRALA